MAMKAAMATMIVVGRRLYRRSLPLAVGVAARGVAFDMLLGMLQTIIIIRRSISQAYYCVRRICLLPAGLQAITILYPSA